LTFAVQLGNYLDVFLPDAAVTEELHIIGAEGDCGLAAQNGSAQQDCAEGNV
jgi:hypothetical protein